MSHNLVITGKLPYQVHKQIGETESYRLYQVSTEGVETSFVLKVAVDSTFNGALDREAFLLSRMRERALKLEEEFGKLNPGKYLNYQLAFPLLHETFVVAEQGGRRVLILGIEAVKDLEKLVPLSMIRTRDCVRVDLKTAAWMLGKSLKILAFAHDFSVSLGDISGDDIVVERDDHLVMVLGGNSITYNIPESVDDDPHGHFQDFVLKLSRGGFATASDAHKAFYHMVEAMWGRKFHPYTTFSL